MACQYLLGVEQARGTTEMQKKGHGLNFILFRVNIVLMNLVIDDSQAGIQIFCCLGLVAIIFFQPVNNKVFFKIFYRRGQRKRFPARDCFRYLQCGGQVNPFNGGTITDEYCPFNTVLKFSYISRPVILNEQIYSRGRYSVDGFVILLTKFIEKEFSQQKYIGTSFS